MTDNTIPILNKSFEDLLQEIDISTRELPTYFVNTYSNHTFAADIKLEKIQAYDRIRLQEFYTQWCHKFDVYHNRITSNVTDITQSLLSIYSKDVYGCVGINYGARFTFNKIVKDNLLCIYENALFEIPDANHYKDTYFKKTFPILIVDKQLTWSFYRNDCHTCYFHFN